MVGGNDLYVSLCRKHYNDGRIGPELKVKEMKLNELLPEKGGLSER